MNGCIEDMRGLYPYTYTAIL